MHRLFVALRPPRPIRERLTGMMGGLAGARWQSDEQLHVTLRFVGEVDRRLAEDIAHALDTVRHPPVTLALAGFGCFDRGGRIHTLWAGVDPADGCASLAKKIDQALVRAGLKPEARAYKPHVTLARFSRGTNAQIGDFVGLHAALRTDSFTLNSFALYESHLGGEGASYEPVARYPLA